MKKGLVYVFTLFLASISIGCADEQFEEEPPQKNYNTYFGDLHNHNNVGYAKGSLERSFEIAQSHLDFYAFTPHTQWHDIAEAVPGDKRFWEEGFQRAAGEWENVQKITASYNDSGNFITLSGYEWHSSFYGDYCLLSTSDNLPLKISPDLDDLKSYSKEKNAIIIPHHPAYRQGNRGANFKYLDTEISPVLEIYSEHGNAESTDGPLPYIRHSMGGRWKKNTLQAALAQGHRIGVIASSDDHLGYPGAYGQGLAVVLAEELTRESIFRAIKKRRTYGVTGDRIKLDFRLNGHVMGEEIPFTGTRKIAVNVTGWDKIDRIEILKNNRVIKRHFPVDNQITNASWNKPVLVRVEMGWGAGGILGLVNVSDWNMDIQVSGGKLNDVYPCFQSGPYEETKRNLIKNKTSEGCSVQSYTSRKQAFAENTTNAIVLDISGNLDTEILLNLEKPAKMTITKSLRELAESNAVTFTGEFPSESIDLHQVVFSDNYSAQFEFTDTVNSEKGTDWYYVRVIQTNGQLAWSSPIWVGK